MSSEMMGPTQCALETSLVYDDQDMVADELTSTSFSREDDSAFECDGTCRLNERWTLRCAKDPFSGPGSTVAVLSGGSTAGLSTYTFEWSKNNVVLASVRSRHSTPPFTTAMSMPVDWIRDELLHSPDTFTLSSLERAALTEAVIFEFWSLNALVARDANSDCTKLFIIFHAGGRDVIFATTAGYHKGKVIEDIAYQLRSQAILKPDTVVGVNGRSGRIALRSYFHIE
ncbi:hypothetical protein LTR47_006975 [Exophiala xenobiotica]|nr:hypothetical protein LTR47_006975 [Exophiala xenobiotica]KAK5353658.1 hypothetical protein LTR61_002352 [Exophiala xenobiotica]KAK5362341.1 hypothetical protein LTS03_010091 [Exophiala xenobiotica]KAK5370467.1 hypothetical protein LTR11_006678 [Exophiala xenobiotica]